MRIDDLRPRPTAAEPLEIPEELLESVHRHQANLAALIDNLKAAGFQEDMVEANVRALVDRYAAELTAAIRTFMRGPGYV